MGEPYAYDPYYTRVLVRIRRTGQFGLERPAAFAGRPPVPHFVQKGLKTLHLVRYRYTVYAIPVPVRT